MHPCFVWIIESKDSTGPEWILNVGRKLLEQGSVLSSTSKGILLYALISTCRQQLKLRNCAGAEEVLKSPQTLNILVICGKSTSDVHLIVFTQWRN